MKRGRRFSEKAVGPSIESCIPDQVLLERAPERHRLQRIKVEAAVERLFVVAHRAWRHVERTPRVVHRGVHQVVARDHALRPAELVAALGGVLGVAPEDHLQRRAEADLAGQRDHPAGAAHVPPHLGDADPRMLRHDADVALHRVVEPAGDGETVDGGDHWLPELHSLGHRRDAATRAGRRRTPGGALSGLRLAGLRGGDQVGARAERAVTSAGENRDARRRIVTELRERLVHRLAEPVSDRVHAMRPVERDHEDLPVLVTVDFDHGTERLLRRIAVVLLGVVGLVGVGHHSPSLRRGTIVAVAAGGRAAANPSARSR